ncbi:MAG: ACT domain-containing protein [Thermoanaerobaculia bacterium]
MDSLTLRLLEGQFAVARLAPDAAMPTWPDGEITSITRTPGELSVVCAEAAVPADVQSSGGWRCLEVAGPLDFAEMGILSMLTGSLASAGVSVFAFSTFDTDYLMVRAPMLDRAVTALEAADCAVIEAAE